MAKGLKVGDEVPDFSAIDLHGEAFQLNSRSLTTVNNIAFFDISIWDQTIRIV